MPSTLEFPSIFPAMVATEAEKSVGLSPLPGRAGGHREKAGGLLTERPSHRSTSSPLCPDHGKRPVLHEPPRWPELRRCSLPALRLVRLQRAAPPPPLPFLQGSWGSPGGEPRSELTPSPSTSHWEIDPPYVSSIYLALKKKKTKPHVPLCFDGCLRTGGLLEPQKSCWLSSAAPL